MVFIVSWWTCLNLFGFLNIKQVWFARTWFVILPVQERGQRRAEQPMGRPVGRLLGIGGCRAAGRRQGAHHRPAASWAQVPRAIRLRTPVVCRAEYDQRQPAWTVRHRQRWRKDRRRLAGRPDRRGWWEDNGNPFRDRPSHHRPRLRGAIRVLGQFSSVGQRRMWRFVAYLLLFVWRYVLYYYRYY